MRIAALFTGLLLSASAPVLAQSDSCYMETSDGRRIKLGALCGEESTPATSAPSVDVTSNNSAKHPFPGWLINYSANNQQRKYETGYKSYGNYSVWAYQKRFLEEFRKWPYIISSENRAEWDYTDCKTGWTYTKIAKLAGDHPEPRAYPPRAFEDIVPGRTERLRRQCRELGINPGF